MENEITQNSKNMFTDFINKIDNIIKKLTLDISNSFIEAGNLDELRRILKVILTKLSFISAICKKKQKSNDKRNIR